MIKPTNSQVFGLGDEWPTLSMGLLSATITGVNFNSGNNDNAIFLPLPFGLTRFFVLRVDTHNANHSLTAANFGVFAAPGGGGASYHCRWDRPDRFRHGKCDIEQYAINRQSCCGFRRVRSFTG